MAIGFLIIFGLLSSHSGASFSGADCCPILLSALAITHRGTPKNNASLAYIRPLLSMINIHLSSLCYFRSFFSMEDSFEYLKTSCDSSHCILSISSERTNDMTILLSSEGQNNDGVS